MPALPSSFQPLQTYAKIGGSSGLKLPLTCQSLQQGLLEDVQVISDFLGSKTSQKPPWLRKDELRLRVFAPTQSQRLHKSSARPYTVGGLQRPASAVPVSSLRRLAADGEITSRPSSAAKTKLAMWLVRFPLTPRVNPPGQPPQLYPPCLLCLIPLLNRLNLH